MFNLYFNRQYIILLALGFSSGVPFLLILSTLSFWLSELYIRKSMLGFLMITSLPYSLKFLWSPFIGTVSLPYFSKKIGYHKSWGNHCMRSCITAKRLSRLPAALGTSNTCSFMPCQSPLCLRTVAERFSKSPRWRYSSPSSG